MSFEISNKDARRLWLASQALAETPTGPLDLAAMIDRLGFVQLDTIQTVARAHDHILWSRNQNYRPKHLATLYKRREVFEHFTHDASVLPMALLPMWRRQFRRMQERIDRRGWCNGMPGPEGRAAIVARIAADGPLCSADFEADAPRAKEMWARPAHKQALDYMWYGGALATCHRRGFTKVYDLGERVFPAQLWDAKVPEQEQVAALCAGALDRMGFGTLGEIRKFWDSAEVAEVKAWATSAELVPLRVQQADGGWYDALGPADIAHRIAGLAPPTSRLRILNPFDPLIRDRARLERLFGFDYRNEMFVPKDKRRWGYYVFPLLEGARFVGRLEAKAHRDRDQLDVMNLWPEPRVAWTRARQGKLEAELARLARFVGVSQVTFSCAGGAEDMTTQGD